MSSSEKMADQYTCETPGCNAPASLQCPTCIKIGIKGSFFCTQECFKGSWKSHKIIHSLARKYRCMSNHKPQKKHVSFISNFKKTSFQIILYKKRLKIFC